MFVKSLKQMESVVKKNKSLRWDGWDVVHFYPSETAWMSQYGSFHKGRWYMNRRFVVSENGWDIPERFLGKNEQR